MFLILCKDGPPLLVVLFYGPVRFYFSQATIFGLENVGPVIFSQATLLGLLVCWAFWVEEAGPFGLARPTGFVLKT